MKNINLLILIATGFILSGCQTWAQYNFSVPNVGVSQTKIDAQLRSLTITNVAKVSIWDYFPDEIPDIGSSLMERIPGVWQKALIGALNQMAIFQDKSSDEINLSVKILKLNHPFIEISSTSDVSARYEITDHKTRDIVFTQDISSSGETPFSYSYDPFVRRIESINRAVQNNIAQFLKSLETVNANKPAFPDKNGEIPPDNSR